MQEPIVRFAPSPTGRIHIGNARTALLNWCFAQALGGQFILRFDDTDLTRSKQEYADAIAEDLAWLGIHPHQSFKQSDRMEAYAAAAEKLKAQGRLYPCYETPEELDRKRKRQLARGLPPVYDRTALELSAEERQKNEAEGRKPHWRFKLSDGVAAWDDLVRGHQSIDLKSLSDPVMIREDGTCLYTFTSVVDDADTGITHIIRGEDHVTNSAAQIDLFRALGAQPPVFAHHNLLTTADGEGLSKRLGHLSLSSLRENGYHPMAVASLAVLIGTAEAVTAYPDLPTLGSHIDLARISRASAKFDIHELDGLNRALIHAMPYEAAKQTLIAHGCDGGEAFWLAVRANLSFVKEAKEWWDVINSPITPQPLEPAFQATALKTLPAEPFTSETWGGWTKAIAAETGLKGKALFMPLRQALTGKEHGPDLAGLLPLIGREKTVARLNGSSS